ncbi:MAG: endonuclease III [Chloroflexota bacterium]|nr:endonuclease III [Chloroflexota bacterium]
MADLAEPAQLIAWTARQLAKVYGRRPQVRWNEPLAELIGTVLSQHTSDVNAGRAFASLRARYANWEAVRDAPPEELRETIRQGGLAAIKAARIQAILRALSRPDGRVAMPDLTAMGVQAARGFLLELPGVGRKTASCVLLFACQLPVIPVDTHVHRVATRLGMAPRRASPEQTCDLLEAAVPPEDCYSFHLNLIRHGREVCKAQRPRCAICTLQTRCRTYQPNEASATAAFFERKKRSS